eukprot:Skav230918  [mRNA]  locus=scaffold2578:78071:82153:- [translate_table: standard]
MVASDPGSEPEPEAADPEGTLFAAPQQVSALEPVTEEERWVLSLPLVGDVKVESPISSVPAADLGELILQEMSSSGDLDRMKSLSSAGHHGGVRVFHDTVEIARVRVTFDEEGACSLPSSVPLQQVLVLTPAVENCCDAWWHARPFGEDFHGKIIWRLSILH